MQGSIPSTTLPKAHFIQHSAHLNAWARHRPSQCQAELFKSLALFYWGKFFFLPYFMSQIQTLSIPFCCSLLAGAHGFGFFSEGILLMMHIYEPRLDQGFWDLKDAIILKGRKKKKSKFWLYFPPNENAVFKQPNWLATHFVHSPAHYHSCFFFFFLGFFFSPFFFFISKFESSLVAPALNIGPPRNCFTRRGEGERSGFGLGGFWVWLGVFLGVGGGIQ